MASCKNDFLCTLTGKIFGSVVAYEEWLHMEVLLYSKVMGLCLLLKKIEILWRVDFVQIELIQDFNKI